MQNKREIQELTQQLIGFCQAADKIYDSVREEGAEKDFYGEVKPFADKVHQAAKEWVIQMKEWMKSEAFTHLYPLQIEQTADNLSDIAVQAFFPKTSYKRFKSHVQSVSFILNNTLSEINAKLSGS
ncbi:YppE family protein [Actinomycetes bacterium NPDC127524]